MPIRVLLRFLREFHPADATIAARLDGEAEIINMMIEAIVDGQKAAGESNLEVAQTFGSERSFPRYRAAYRGEGQEVETEQKSLERERS